MEDKINTNINKCESGHNYINDVCQDQDDNSDSLHLNIPKTSISDNSYSDFYKICKAYYKELKRTTKGETKTEIKITKDDAIVLNDLIKEIHTYSNFLIKNNFIKESSKLLDLGVKIVDFMIKLFSTLSEKDYNTKEKQGDKSDVHYSQGNTTALPPKVAYPLSLKLFLLETKFDILFQQKSNYKEAEKIIEEVIKIQNILQLPYYNLGCSKFFLALIKFYLNDIKTCETMTLEALKIFERMTTIQIGTRLPNEVNANSSGENIKTKEGVGQVREDDAYYMENRITRKMSNILEFLAELYDLKKDYANVIAYYEKAYYLNLGRYGPKNVNTEYFKIKLEIVHEQIHNGSYAPLIGNYQKITNLTNLNISNNSKQTIPNATFQRDATTVNNLHLNICDNNTSGKNIIYKGRTDTLTFAVPLSNLYDPLLISIYENASDGSSSNDIPLKSEAFVGNLLMDKNGVFKFLNVFEKISNNLIYIEDNLMKIISRISLVDGNIQMNDAILRNSLINRNAMMATQIQIQSQSQSIQYPKINRK